MADLPHEQQQEQTPEQVAENSLGATMKTVKIFGYSDDNIEIRGDLGDDEFGAYGGWRYLHFDDGAVVKGGYSKVPGKGWTFEVLKLGPNGSSAFVDPMLEDGDHFSDVLEITGNFTSARVWSQAAGPTESELIEILVDFDWRDLQLPQLSAVYAAATAKV